MKLLAGGQFGFIFPSLCTANNLFLFWFGPVYHFVLNRLGNPFLFISLPFSFPFLFSTNSFTNTSFTLLNFWYFPLLLLYFDFFFVFFLFIGMLLLQIDLLPPEFRFYSSCSVMIYYLTRFKESIVFTESM